MACIYASNHKEMVEGVLLFGTYCGTDISNSSLKGMSVNGEQDGMFPLADIQERRGELPSDAYRVQVPGMNHAQIGNYGPQSGDNEPTISDSDARQALAEAVQAFFSERCSYRRYDLNEKHENIPY